MFGSMKATIGDWNERIALPTWAGLMAGLFGTAIILVLVMAMMVLLNTDVWTAAHDTLAAILGVDYAPDTFQILVGSIVHLLISAALGAVFTSMPCCFPRNFWIVSGLIYGMATGFIACVALNVLMMLFGLTGSVNYFLVMWFNVVYGLLYGLAATTYDWEWAFVTRLRRRIVAGKQ
jgi:hypothetical protein